MSRRSVILRVARLRRKGFNKAEADFATEESGTEDDTLQPWRIALADDHTDILEEIRSLLEPEFQVVCMANEGSALLRGVDASRPDGVVADVQMPGLSGIDAGREIVKQGLCNAVVMLSMYNDPALIQSALVAGIRGYVLKEDAGDELIPALQKVLSGGSYLSRHVRSCESV